MSRQIFHEQVHLAHPGSYADIEVYVERKKVKAAVSLYEGFQDDCGSATLTDEELDVIANHLLRAASLMRHERILMERDNG